MNKKKIQNMTNKKKKTNSVIFNQNFYLKYVFYKAFNILLRLTKIHDI